MSGPANAIQAAIERGGGHFVFRRNYPYYYSPQNAEATDSLQCGLVDGARACESDGATEATEQVVSEHRQAGETKRIRGKQKQEKKKGQRSTGQRSTLALYAHPSGMHHSTHSSVSPWLLQRRLVLCPAADHQFDCTRMLAAARFLHSDRENPSRPAARWDSSADRPWGRQDETRVYGLLTAQPARLTRLWEKAGKNAIP